MDVTSGWCRTQARWVQGIAALVLMFLLASCTGRSAPSPSPAEASSQACIRPALDDPEALVARQSAIGQVLVPGTLVNRFAAATRAFEAAANAPDVATARCAAENVLYVLSGRLGRYGPADALTPGILPPDRDPLSDPGLAISAMAIMPDPSTVDAIGTGIVGDGARWSTPTAAWNELDAAVANGTVANLDSPTMQAIGWALLTQRAASLDDARNYARSGLAVASQALQTAREVLAAGCAAFPEAECQ